MEGNLVITAQLLERVEPLRIGGGQRARLLVKLHGAVSGEPLAGRAAGCDQRRERPPAKTLADLRIVEPGKIRIVTRHRGQVMVSDQLCELISAVSGKLLDPGRNLGVGARAARLRKARIGDVAHQSVLEDVFGLPGEGGGRPHEDEAFALQADESVGYALGAQGLIHGCGPEGPPDDGRLLEGAPLHRREGINPRR